MVGMPIPPSVGSVRPDQTEMELTSVTREVWGDPGVDLQTWTKRLSLPLYLFGSVSSGLDQTQW